MNAGMLWFDNDARTALSSKVSQAAEYYRSKYGRLPNLCLVHPSMLHGQLNLVEGATWKVTVRPNRIIQPDYLWIGSEDNH